MIRSGQLKSSTAQPSVKNIGCDTIVACNPASLMALFQLARRAHRNRSHDRQNRRLGRQPRNPQGNVGQALRFVFGQENHVGSAGKSFNVGGIRQPAGPHIAPDDFFQILFEERDVALGHLHHARPVGMTAGNWGAKIRQAGRNHCPKISRPVNADLHLFSLLNRKPAPQVVFDGIGGRLTYSLSTTASPYFQCTGGRCT